MTVRAMKMPEIVRKFANLRWISIVLFYSFSTIFPPFIQNLPYDLTLRKPAAQIEDRAVFFSHDLKDAMLDKDIKMMPDRGVVHPELFRQLVGVQRLRGYRPENLDASRTTPRPLEQPPEESPSGDLGQS